MLRYAHYSSVSPVAAAPVPSTVPLSFLPPLSIAPSRTHFSGLISVCLIHAPIGKAACCSFISPIRRNGYVAQPPARYSQCVDSGRVLGVALGLVRCPILGISCKKLLARPIPFWVWSLTPSAAPSPPTGSPLAALLATLPQQRAPLVTCDKKEFSFAT